MKKLIIACAAVLVLGLGLTTVGHARRTVLQRVL